KRGHEKCPVRMVRAGDIEGIVFDQIKAIFRDPATVVKTLRAAEADTGDGMRLTKADIREGLQSLDAVWDHLYHAEQARLLQLFVKKIRVEPDGIHIEIRTNGIQSLMLDLKANRRSTGTTSENDNGQPTEELAA